MIFMEYYTGVRISIKMDVKGKNIINETKLIKLN